MLAENIFFVTGASGFVGSHLINRLIQLPATVHCIRRSDSSNSRLNQKSDNLFFHDVDITNFKQVKSLLLKINPQAIFHLANQGVYGGFENDPAITFEVNLTGTINMLQASKNISYSLFVNTGSSAEYGSKTQKMKESDSCFPHGAYATAKLAGTLYAESFARLHNKPVVTLRLFSPYGPDDDPRRLIPFVVKKALQNELIKIGSKKPVRDFIFIDDVIDAYIHCLLYKNTVAGEILNIGSGMQYSVGDVVDTVLTLTKSKSKVSFDRTIKRNESQVWQADISKAKNLLSWQPKISFASGLKKTISWYQDEIR